VFLPLLLLKSRTLLCKARVVKQKGLQNNMKNVEAISDDAFLASLSSEFV
jgi:hypothetical protein